MALSRSIYNLLSTTAPLVAFTSQRVYPVIAPQSAKKTHIVFQQISGIPVHAMVQDPGLSLPRWQFDVWSTDYRHMELAANQLRETLQDYSSTSMGGNGGIPTLRVLFEGETDFSEIDSVTKKLHYRKSQDYFIWNTTDRGA